MTSIHDADNDAVFGKNLSAYQPMTTTPDSPDLSALAAIGERLRTQDNCGTADPIFQVRGLRRIYGMDPDYANERVWIYTEDGAIEIDPPEDPENPGEFVIETGYIDIWEVLAVAFTKKGCEEHLKLSGHSYRHGYKKVKIYAVYIYRCPEMLAIREALMALPGESAPPPEPPTVMEALAARPLLEQVARLGDCIGANTVGKIMAISSRAAAWLEANPPGQPVAIEPRGCPLPGACSCVEPATTPPEPPTSQITFNAASPPEEVIRLDKEGFHYKGQFVADAGKAHHLMVAFLEQNNKVQSEPPTDEELWAFWNNHDGPIPAILRAALERWGHR